MLQIKLKPGQKIFITSDTHYNHKNICRGVSNWSSTDSTRDFQTLQDMNYTIVKNINDVVAQHDILYHLGDWSFGGFEFIKAFRDRIICQDIRLILGNHDHHIENNRENIQSLFTSVNQYSIIQTIEDDHRHEFVLSHFPICSWHDMNRGRFHLFGHVHLPSHKKIMGGRSMDVGMDGNYMKPYELKSIVRVLSGRSIQANTLPSDHHEKKIR